MTLNEALNEIKSHGLYLVEDGAFGSYDEYIAKLNDLWIDMRDENEFRSIDELISEDEWYKSIVDDGYDSEKEPSEVIDEILNSIENDDNIDSESEFDYTDDPELADDEVELTSYDDEFDDNNINGLGLEDEENIYGESYRPGVNLMLNESWYNNQGLSEDEEDRFKKLLNRYASFTSKRRDNNDRMPKGSMMKPSNRIIFFREFVTFLNKFESLHKPALVRKIQENYLQTLTDEGYLNFLVGKNPEWSEADLREFVGHADIAEADEYLGGSEEERAERRHAREESERHAREEAEAAERARQRRENPEPEDLVNDEYEEGEAGEVTTQRVQRHRMRTGQRYYHDTNNIPVASITINIDTTNDPETLAEAEELAQTIKERLQSEYANDATNLQLCSVEAANVDVDDVGDGTAGTEYHVVIKMPAEIKTEIAEFVKNEMEDVFTFVNSEHPDDTMYSFETEGDRIETYEEEYDFDEPVVPRRRAQRPQVTTTRRIPRAKKWSVMYKVADEEGRDTGRTKWVHGVKAASAEDAMDKVENPEDIESAYATDVFKALRAVQR